LSDLEAAVGRVLRGERAAFADIVHATSDRLVRMAARMTGNMADAEEIVQEAYVKAYRALSQGKFDQRSAVDTWLYRIVTNAAIDAMRERARRPEPRDPASDVAMQQAGGFESAEARVALVELAGFMQDLPADQRAALVLKSLEGLTSTEIAALTGSSEGAVEQRLVRARTALRERTGQ
jgi:RNA polymerase sigma-70 factor (ECF subfamily)